MTSFVTSLQLNGNGLSGAAAEIGPSLTTLLSIGRGCSELATAPRAFLAPQGAALLRLNLAFNDLDGSIADLLPWGSETLANVQFISLAGNFLDGFLPEHAFTVPNASSSNQEDNPRGHHGLTHLEELHLNDNRLCGELPVAMVLAARQLGGPSSSPSTRHGGSRPTVSLPKLRVLNVSSNLLRGPLQRLLLGSGDINRGKGVCDSTDATQSPLESLSIANNGFDDNAWQCLVAASRKFSPGHIDLFPALRSVDLRGNDFVAMPLADVRLRLKRSLSPGATVLLSSQSYYS